MGTLVHAISESRLCGGKYIFVFIKVQQVWNHTRSGSHGSHYLKRMELPRYSSYFDARLVFFFASISLVSSLIYPSCSLSFKVSFFSTFVICSSSPSIASITICNPSIHPLPQSFHIHSNPITHQQPTRSQASPHLTMQFLFIHNYILSILLPLLVLPSLVLSAPHPSAVPTKPASAAHHSRKFTLKSHVLSPPNPAFDNLDLEPYHIYPAFNYAVLVSGQQGIVGYLNGTRQDFVDDTVSTPSCLLHDSDYSCCCWGEKGIVGRIGKHLEQAWE